MTASAVRWQRSATSMATVSPTWRSVHIGDDTGGNHPGAVHVLFMNADGTVKSRQKIGNNTAGGPTLADGDYFGSSVASLGDLDGDGVTDLAVGATR